MLRVAMSPKVLRLGVRWALHLKTPQVEAPPPQWERRSGSTALRAHSGESGTGEAAGADPEIDPAVEAAGDDSSRLASSGA
jgi:hypothetical protein